ncbi:hypothetical protein [uncultured Brachyspira sp.]|jgi:hypothetical protein|uniref:hypothetical protein n=1 Tax=uncultured Brachyspira sp. TaxID=221953 RepID=UPI00258C8485|nr:hypothetical protein [uncultured Brachyspira sp.]
MEITIGIKDKKDEIYDIVDNIIAVKKENGDFEIMKISIDDENMYRVSQSSIKIIFGKKKLNSKEKEEEYLFLNKSDKVFRILYSNIYIKKKNGDFEVFKIEEKTNGICIGKDILKITNGKKTVSILDENSDIEIRSF